MKKKQSARAAALSVIERLHSAGHVALLAGGCVRDALLGVEPKDYDVVTDARPQRVAELFRRTEMVGAKFGVALVRVGGRQIEVATFRADGKYSDGRRPDSVVFGNEVDDAHRRDFTINGMFLDVLENRVIDHVGGRRDLEARVVRAIGEPERRFEEDHLRLLRAVRFAARLGFDVEPETLAAMRRHSHRLETISAERVREEFRLIVTDPTRVVGWQLIVSADLADHILPGVVYSSDRAHDVERRLAALPEVVGFASVLSIVLHSVEPKEAERICRRFTCSNVECSAVAWLLEQLSRVLRVDRLDLADIKRLRADPKFEQLCVRLHAELCATDSPMDAWESLRSRAAAIPADELAPPPFVTGGDLLSRNVPQGPDYARILEALYRAQLNKEIVDRASALRTLDALITEL